MASSLSGIQILLTILYFASSATSGPTGYKSTSICSPYCSQTNEPGKFQYEIGTTYVYKYTTNIQTQILEEDVQSSTLMLTSNVEIDVVSLCEFNLQLRDVLITVPNSDGNALHLQKALEEHALRFSFQDGQIDHICSHPDEPLWVTNVKRGAISMLQNTMEDFDTEFIAQEADINGKCSTQYNPYEIESKWLESKSIKKYKDLSTCSNRKGYVSTIQSVPYASNTNSAGQGSANFLTGHVTCTQTIVDMKIESVDCLEEQILKPFENQGSGAKNRITQTLVLTTTYETRVPQRVRTPVIRKPLTYQMDISASESVDDYTMTLVLLRKLETLSSPSVKAEAPAVFVEIVENLRQLTEPALRSLVKTLEKEDELKKLLMDAIPLANSGSSMAIMRDFYMEGILTQEQSQSWLSSIAFIKDPTPSMINALLPLLDDHSSSELFLGVSSIVHSYCKSAPDCSKDPLITEVINKTSLQVTSSSSECVVLPNNVDIRRAVVGLKALGNIGVHPSKPVLENCAMERSNSIEVRLAALDAFRRMSCYTFSTTPFLSLYADMTESTEVRIGAYIVAMRCASRRTLEVIHRVMDTEVVNQVGSFVWTHLTNLQETSRLEKQWIRNLLESEVLKNKFRTDARKFSRNYESSFFSTDYNVGAGLDANIIFTEESFLPKSGMANMSIQLFGETINLLEFGGRLNGAEHLLEPIFGPEGYFPDESMSSFLQNKRPKREASEKIPATEGSFYARIFGNEVLFKDIRINTESTLPIPNVKDESGKTLFSIKTLLDNLSTGKKMEFTRSAILMDLMFSVPTVSGLPLNLGFKASSTTGLKAEGKFNVGKYMEKKHFEIYGILRPNFAVNVDASLTIRLGGIKNNFIRSGLTLRNVLRSSTAIETNLEIKGRNSFQAAVNFPQDRQDIFQASSTVILLNALGDDRILNENEQGRPRIEHKGCIGDKFKDFFGIRLCGELTAPNNFTLTPSTPAGISLYLEKTDEFKGYKLDYDYDYHPNKDSHLKVIIDTPGSTVKRHSSLTFLAKPSLGTFLATLTTPSKMIQLNGVYSGPRKSLDLSVVENGDKLLELNSSLMKVGELLTPKFTLMVHKRPIAELKGMIQLPIMEENFRKANIDLSLLHVTQTPIRIHGNFLAKDESHEVSLGVESYYLTGTIHSSIKNRRGHWSSRSLLEYSWKHGPPSTIDMSAKLQKSQKGTLSKLALGANLLVSNYPDHNIDFNWETLTSAGYCDNVASLTIGKSTWNARSLYSRQNTRDLDELRVLFSLTNPRDDIDYLLEFSHRMLDASIGTRFTARSSNKNEIKGKFQYDAVSKPFMSRNVTLQILWPGSDYNFAAALVEKRKGEFDGELFINLNAFREMKATITYINKSTNLKLDHLVDFRARGFFSVPISGSIGFSVTDQQSHIGCQILIEGKKPYSSRLSTSIDYSHTRNAHKIEAKVTFNERKYNSEILFGFTKSGAKYITVDLYLEKHIYFEGKISGTYPNAISGSFSLVPNKDNFPQDKLEMRGLLNMTRIELDMNYFDEKVSLHGSLDDESIKGEILWNENKKISVSAAISNEFTPFGGTLSLEVVTPFEFLHQMALNWDHKVDPEFTDLKANLQGNVDSKSITWKIKGRMNTLSEDFYSNSLIHLSGYPRTEFSLLFNNRDNRKNLKLEFNKESQIEIFNLDYISEASMSNATLEFKGFSFLPEILLECSQSLEQSHKWTIHTRLSSSASSAASHLHFQLEKSFRPTSYNLSLFTSWDKFPSTSLFLLIDPMSSTYQLSMDNIGTGLTKVDEHIMPIKLSFGIQGTLASFSHHLIMQWLDAQPILDITLEGSFESTNKANIQGNLRTPSNNYTVYVESKSQDAEGHRKFQILTQGTDIGLQLIEQPSKKKLSLWGTQNKAMLVFERDGQLEKVTLSLSNTEKDLLRIQGDLLSSNWQFWYLNLNVNSELQIIPSFESHFTHNMIDMTSNILSIHRIRLMPQKLPSFWNIPTERNYSMQFLVSNLEKLHTFVEWDDTNLEITGEIQGAENGGKRILMDITSTLFKPINVLLSFDYNKDLTASVLVTRDALQMLNAEIKTETKLEKIFISSFFKSVYTSDLIGKIEHDSKVGSLNTILEMDNNTVFTLKSLLKTTMKNGQFKTEIRSTVFESLENINLDASYAMDLQEESLQLGLKYSSTSTFTNYDISLSASWGDVKALRLLSLGDLIASMEITLEEMQKFTASLSYDNYKLGEIQIDYQPVISDYSWGKHLLLFRFIRGDNAPIKIILSICADPKKFEIEVKTPFKLWTHLKIFLDLDFQSSSKFAKFGIIKEQDKLDSAFEFKAFKRNATFILNSEVNVKGFKEIRQMLLEDMLNVSSNANVEGRFSASSKWSLSNMQLTIETPVDRWRFLQFSASSTTNEDSKQSRSQGFNWNRDILLTCDINNQHHEFNTTVNIGRSTGNIDFQVISNEKYVGKFVYDVSSTTYKFGVDLNAPYEKKWSGQVELRSDEIVINSKTPLKGFETVKINIFYKNNSQQEDERQEMGLEWEINNESKALAFKFIRKNKSSLEIELRTPLETWENVFIVIDYDDNLQNITLKADRGEGDSNFALMVTRDLVGSLTNISQDARMTFNMTILTPFEEYKKMNLFINYKRFSSESEHSAAIDYTRNNQLLKLQVELLYNNRNPHSVDLLVDLSSLENFSSKAKATLSINPLGNSSFAAVVEFNEFRHEVNAAVDLSQGRKKIALTTSLPFLKQLEFSLSGDIQGEQKNNFKRSLVALWEDDNGKRFEIKSAIDFQGYQNAMINFSLISPFTGFQSIFLELNAQIPRDSKTFKSTLTLQNDNSRWVVKIDGDGMNEGLSLRNGIWSIQLNTPILGFSEINISSKQKWKLHNPTKEFLFSVSKNSKKLFQSEVTYAGTMEKGFQCGFTSAILEYPIVFHSAGKLNTLQATLSIGDDDEKTNMEINIQDSGYSALIHLQSALWPQLSSRVVWKLELDEGNAWASVTNQIIGGTQTVRTLWKIKSLNDVKIELWLRSNQEDDEIGGILQYSLKSVNEASGMQKLVLLFETTFSEKNKKANSFNFIGKFNSFKEEEIFKYFGEVNLKSSFVALRTFEAAGTLALGTEIAINLNSTFNNLDLFRLESTILLAAQRSKLTLAFANNSSFPIGNLKSFQTFADYDIRGDNKSFQLNFQQDGHTLNLYTSIHIPADKTEIELNLGMHNNVTHVGLKPADGLLRATYKFHPHDLTHQIEMDLKSDQVGDWYLVGSIRPRSEDFQFLLRLNSSTPEDIPKIHLDANWRGNLKQRFTSSVTLKFQDVAFNYTLSLTSDSVKLTLRTPLEFLNDLILEGLLQGSEGRKEAIIKIVLNKQIYALEVKGDLTPNFKQGQGSILFIKGENKDGVVVAGTKIVLTPDGGILFEGNWLERELKIEGQFQKIKGDEETSWITAGTTELHLSIDGLERASMTTNHNLATNGSMVALTVITDGEENSLSVQIERNSFNTIVAKGKWSSKRIHFVASSTDDSFDATLSTPWTLNTTVYGKIQKLSSQTILEGSLTYGRQGKSQFRLLTNTNVTRSQPNLEILLDIPALNQKLEVVLFIQPVNLTGGSGGNIEINVNGALVSVSGEFWRKMTTDAFNNKNVENKLSLSLSLPSTIKANKMSLQVLSKRSLHHNGNFKLNANLLFDERRSEFSMGYDIPVSGSTNTLMGVHGSLNLKGKGTSKNYSFNLKSNGPSIRDFTGEVTCGSKSISLNWKFQLPNIMTTIKIATDINSEEYLLSIIGHVDPFKTLNVTLDANCKDRSLGAHFFVNFDVDSKLICEGNVHSPNYAFLNHRYRFQLEKQLVVNTPGNKYILEMFGVHEDFNINLLADCTIGPKELNVNGKLTGAIGTIYGRFDYEKELSGKHQANMTIESLSLIAGKKITVKGELTPMANGEGFEASVQCRTKKDVHIAIVTVEIKENEGKMFLSLESQALQQKQPLFIQGEWKTEGSKFTGQLVGGGSFDNFNLESPLNLLKVVLDVKNLEGRITVDSPLIPSSKFGVHLKCKFHTEGIDVLGDVQIRTYHWRFEGVLNYQSWKDMQAKVEIVTPNKSFDRLTLALKSVEDEIYAEIYTPVKAIPNAVLKINGLTAFRTKNWKDLDSGVMLGLPFGTYSASCVYKNWNSTNAGYFHVLLRESMTGSNTQTFEVFSSISPMSYFTMNMNKKSKLHIRVLTPSDTLDIFELELEGRIKGRNALQLTSSSELNGEKVSLAFSYDNENGNPKIHSKISSPFEMYENVTFTLSFDTFQKIGNGRSLHMEFDNPLWTDKITLDADYRFKYTGILDMEGEINSVLISFMDLPQIHFEVKTSSESPGILVTFGGQIGSYPGTLRVLCNFGEEDFSMVLVSKLGENDEYDIGGKFQLIRQDTRMRLIIQLTDDQNAVVDIHGTFSSAENIAGGFLRISTPFGPLECTVTLIPLSAFGFRSENSLPLLSFRQMLVNTNATLNLHFNHERLIGLQFISSNGVNTLEIYNPLRPISLLVSFEHYSKSQVKAIVQFCWDTENPIGQTVGGGIEWSRGILGKGNQIHITLKGERLGELDLTLVHTLFNSKFNQTALVKWNRPLLDASGEWGYSMAMSKDSTNSLVNLQIHFPSRSIAFDLFSNTTSPQKEIVWLMDLKWDARRDLSKILSVKFQKEIETAWRVSETSYFLEIIHPQLQYPLMISMDQIYKDNRFQHIEMDIKVSENAQDNFVFLISRNNTDWKTFKVNLKHVPSNILVTVDLHSYSKELENSVGVDLSYMDVTGEIRNLSIEAFAEIGRYELKLFSYESSDVIILKSQVHQEHVVLQGRFFSFSGDAFVQTTLPFLEAIIKQNGDDIFKISGGFSHKKKIGIHIARLDAPNNVDYFVATMELTSAITNSLSTRVNWLPNLFSHILELDVPKMFSSSVLGDIHSMGLLYNMVQEFRGRWEQISPEIKRSLANFGEFAAAEISTLYEEWLNMLEYFKQLYDNNVLYIKDIVDCMGVVGEFIYNIGESICKKWCKVKSFFLSLVRHVSECIDNFLESYDGSFEKLFMDCWTRMEDFVNAIWNDNMSTISSLVENTVKTIKIFVSALEGKVDEMERKLMATGLCRKLAQLYRDYATWIEELPIQEFTKKLENMMDMKIWDRLSNYLSPLIDAIKNGVEDEYFVELMNTPPLPYIRYAFSTFHSTFNKLWEALEIEHRIKGLIQASLKNLDGLIHRYLPTGKFIYSLDEGSISYDQSLSTIEWIDFTQIPHWRSSQEEKKDVSQLTNFYYQTMDTIESLKPLFALNLRNVLPPFGSYALLAGDYHYFTFDKHYFRFAGECSYILLADQGQTNDPFSLIVNYENRDGVVRKKSYSVTTTGGAIVEIDIVGDFKVTLNGKKMELPLMIGSLYIRRHQSGLELYDKRGFTMTCSFSSCNVEVSGWHFGKLGGLLGTYDNEPRNDFQSPSRLLMNDVSAFAYSWRVGKNSGTCRMKNFAKDESPLEDVDRICEDLLVQRSSPLRPCFNTVSTEVFMEMCKYDISRNVNNANRAQAACSAMSAYVTECQKNKIDVWMPPTCVRCRLEDGTALTTGENATLSLNGERSPPQSSDTVILLDETSCVSHTTLNEAIRRLDLALNTNGIQDNRYAIVGYGGDDIHQHPHIKTSSANVWSHRTLFKISNYSSTVSPGVRDTASKAGLYDAIQYAATLGFRAGVSKNFIAVTCGEDNCGDPSRYGDILTLLVENDIKLHMLTPKPFTLKGNRKQDEINQIYGIDMAGVYTLKHAKSGILDPDIPLKRQLNIPKDFCTPLAMESNGTRFNVEHPTKKVLDVWSRRVAQTSYPTSCQRCECLPDRFGSASLMCHQCVSPSLWKFMEEWKSYQFVDGEEEIPPEFFEQGDFNDFSMT